MWKPPRPVLVSILLDAAVAQMDDAVGARGNFRIVRDDDHRQPVVPEQAAKQIEDGRAGFGIEISRRFIRQQQRGTICQRAGDGDALFFAAGQVRWVCGASFARGRRIRAGSSARARRACSGIFRQHQRRFHVFHRGQRRQQIETLEDEADALAAMTHKLRFGGRPSDKPSTRISPPLGRSRPPMRFSNVDLPEPEGPTNAVNSPRGTVRSTSDSAATTVLPTL